MHRSLRPLALSIGMAFALGLAGPLAPARAAADDGVDRALLAALFEQSRTEKKGLTIFLPGHTLAIVVTAVHGDGTVEGRNQEFSRVLISVDEILAAALQ